MEKIEKYGWDIYHCYHEDNYIIQKMVHATKSAPKCSRCGRIMTFGRFTSQFDNGSMYYKPIFSF